jgi:hypothetical protein
MSSVNQSSRLESCRNSAPRSAALPPSPNSRSKTSRGCASAGSGVVGLEALSRGAGLTLFVERDRKLGDAIRSSAQILYSRNGKVISHSYIDFAKALEGVKGDAVIDGELVALDKHGVSHFQLLQNALRHEAKLLYCVFDLMFHDGQDLRGLTLLERKERLKGILPRHRLIGFSRHRQTFGTKFFGEAERQGLEGIMAQAGRKHLRVRRPYD